MKKEPMTTILSTLQSASHCHPETKYMTPKNFSRPPPLIRINGNVMVISPPIHHRSGVVDPNVVLYKLIGIEDSFACRESVCIVVDVDVLFSLTNLTRY